MKKKQSFLLGFLKPITQSITDSVSKNLSKQIKQTLPDKKTTDKLQTWDFPVGFNMMSSNKTKFKPEGRISYEKLRNFSVHSPIVRSAIDYLKTKIQKLSWQIIPENETDEINDDDPKVILLRNFFKHPTGKRSNYREFIDALIEDYLVIGSVAMEKKITFGNDFYGQVKLVDSSTIKRYIVEDTGEIPEPPLPAYCQVIKGVEVAKLTEDEMIYEVRSARTNTVYGLSPIESIVVQIDSALRGSLYSYAWYTDGNVPEGLLQVPKEWTTKQIKDFERYFNSMLSGNFINQRKIKIVPEGSSYVPFKKPNDLGYEKFELWILQLICTVFGVPPQDIGFTHQINKSSSNTQQELGQERGMRPIAQFLEILFTNIIQYDFGFQDLKFKYTDIDPVDAKEEAEIQIMRIESGLDSVDEIRTKEGKEAIGLGHYIKGSQSIILVDELLNPKEEPDNNILKPDKEDQSKEEDKEDDVKEKLQKQDILLWRKKALRDYKRNIPFKKFSSSCLDDWMIDEIFGQLKKIENKDQINSVFTPYLKGSMQVFYQLKKMSDEINQQSNQSNTQEK